MTDFAKFPTPRNPMELNNNSNYGSSNSAGAVEVPFERIRCPSQTSVSSGSSSHSDSSEEPDTLRDDEEKENEKKMVSCFRDQ